MDTLYHNSDSHDLLAEVKSHTGPGNVFYLLLYLTTDTLFGVTVNLVVFFVFLSHHGGSVARHQFSRPFCLTKESTAALGVEEPSFKT